MLSFVRPQYVSQLLSAMVMASACGVTVAQTPATLPALRSEAEIMKSLQAINPRINQLVGDDAALGDPANRRAVAVEAVPLLKQFRLNYDELVGLKPQMQRQAKGMHLQLDQTLAILGDPLGVANLQNMVASTDALESLAGQSAQLMVRWVTAGRDEAEQSKIADDIEKLDRAHTDNVSLTITTAKMSRSAATPALAERLDKLAMDVMKNPAVAQIKMQRERAAAADNMKQMVDKPFVLAAKTVDGKPFSTADWAGKVVLVDFWATWCGPCIAELPTLQKLYEAKHAEGFEVVGVSNDYSSDALRGYAAKNSIPWPQLFDAAAAAEQQWNPTTLGYGISGIPHMFVIDKKGVLRSADARQNYQELVVKLLAE